MEKYKGAKAITLVALVITIVILLILAGISISTLTNTGIFQKAKDAKKASENAEKEQKQTLSEYEKELNKYNAQELTDDKINTVLSETENTVLKDANGNIFTLPAGFKVVVNDDTGSAKTVDKGIVIEDATDAATKGSQFVWVPVGKIYTDVERTEENTKTITLGRYEFDAETGVESLYSGDYVEEEANSISSLKKWGNAIAKNITNFKDSVEINAGYYIGRYEAGVIGYDTNNIIESNNNKETNWTGYINVKGEKLQLVSKANQQVWNYITQNKAAELSQSMYNSDKFISDLMNSYAWDTAITFIQKCTDKTNYANQNRGENASLLNTGRTNDNPCNIFDMVGNIVEWTTETSNSSIYPCTRRGGDYNSSRYCTNSRTGDYTFNNYATIGFRPILYINN